MIIVIRVYIKLFCVRQNKKCIKQQGEKYSLWSDWGCRTCTATWWFALLDRFRIDTVGQVRAPSSSRLSLCDDTV